MILSNPIKYARIKSGHNTLLFQQKIHSLYFFTCHILDITFFKRNTEI